MVGSFTDASFTDLSYTKDAAGAQALNDLTDVTITNPQDDDHLEYNDSINRWENKPHFDASEGSRDLRPNC